jgi:hypothetical protein
MYLVGSLRSLPGEVLRLLDNETGMHCGVEPKPCVAGGNRQ